MWIKNDSLVADVEIAVEESLIMLEKAAENLRWAFSQCRGTQYCEAYVMPQLEGTDSMRSWIGNTFAVDLVRQLLVEIKQQRCELEVEELIQDQASIEAEPKEEEE